MQQSHSCFTTDRLCIQYREVELNQPLEVFWPVGLVPEISDLSKLKIYIYQSDLLRNPQADPCNIAGLKALNSWTPLVISTQNPDFPLLKSTSITIPASQEILSAMSSENNFFLQIKSQDNQLCSIGPYSIPNPFTSFKLKLPRDGSVTNTSGNNGDVSQVPNSDTTPISNPGTSSLIDRTDLQIGLGVGLGVLTILIVLIAIILRHKVRANEKHLKAKQLREDISKLSIALSNEFAISSDDLIPKDLIKEPEDRHQIIVMENNAVSMKTGASST